MELSGSAGEKGKERESTISVVKNKLCKLFKQITGYHTDAHMGLKSHLSPEDRGAVCFTHRGVEAHGLTKHLLFQEKFPKTFCPLNLLATDIHFSEITDNDTKHT